MLPEEPWEAVQVKAQNHGITEEVRLEGTTMGHPCPREQHSQENWGWPDPILAPSSLPLLPHTSMFWALSTTQCQKHQALNSFWGSPFPSSSVKYLILGCSIWDRKHFWQKGTWWNSTFLSHQAICLQRGWAGTKHWKGSLCPLNVQETPWINNYHLHLEADPCY